MTPTIATLTSGTVLLTVVPCPIWRRVRELLGDEYHPEYRYRIERVEHDSGHTLFLHTWTVSPRYPDRAGKWVYTGIVHPRLGTIRLTTKSAFPAHATRVKVAEHVLRAIFGNRAGDIERANWTVTATVEKELAGRF